MQRLWTRAGTASGASERLLCVTEICHGMVEFCLPRIKSRDLDEGQLDSRHIVSSPQQGHAFARTYG